MLRLVWIGCVLFAALPAWAAAKVDLEVTIAVDTGVESCAMTEHVHVMPGTAVRICYGIENVGDVTLGTHDLVDVELGGCSALRLRRAARTADRLIPEARP